MTVKKGWEGAKREEWNGKKERGKIALPLEVVNLKSSC